MCGDPRTFFVTARPSNCDAASSPATLASKSRAATQTFRYLALRRRRRAFAPGSDESEMYPSASTATRSETRGHSVVRSVCRHLETASGGRARVVVSGSARLKTRGTTRRGPSRPTSATPRGVAEDGSPGITAVRASVRETSPCAAHSLRRSHRRSAPFPPDARTSRSRSGSDGAPNSSSLRRTSVTSRGASCDCSETPSRSVSVVVSVVVCSVAACLRRRNLACPSAPGTGVSCSRASASEAASPVANVTSANPTLGVSGDTRKAFLRIATSTPPTPSSPPTRKRDFTNSFVQWAWMFPIHSMRCSAPSPDGRMFADAADLVTSPASTVARGSGDEW